MQADGAVAAWGGKVSPDPPEPEAQGIWTDNCRGQEGAHGRRPPLLSLIPVFYKTKCTAST